MKYMIVLLFASVAFAQELPDAPTPIATKAFWTVIATNAVFTSLDAYTTVAIVGHTVACPYEVGNPELYGHKPTATRTGLVMGALFAASTFTTYELKRRHRAHIWRIPLWELPSGYEAYGHALGGVHNLTHC